MLWWHASYPGFPGHGLGKPGSQVRPRLVHSAHRRSQTAGALRPRVGTPRKAPDLGRFSPIHGKRFRHRKVTDDKVLVPQSEVMVFPPPPSTGFESPPSWRAFVFVGLRARAVRASGGRASASSEQAVRSVGVWANRRRPSHRGCAGAHYQAQPTFSPDANSTAEGRAHTLSSITTSRRSTGSRGANQGMQVKPRPTSPGSTSHPTAG